MLVTNSWNFHFREDQPSWNAGFTWMFTTNSWNCPLPTVGSSTTDEIGQLLSWQMQMMQGSPASHASLWLCVVHRGFGSLGQ